MLNKFFSELRVRLIFILIAWFVTLIISYKNKEILLFIIIKPIIFSKNLDTFYFIATSLTDVFSVYLQIVYFITNQLTMFFLIWQILSYITPALYHFEYKKLCLTIFFSIIFLLVSLFLLNIYILPVSWEFFSNFHENSSKCVNVFLEIKITEYFNLYIVLYYITIIINQIFLFIFIFLDLIKNKLVFIKKTRKFFYILFFLIATIITPPDVISQILLGCWFIFIYEFIIVMLILKNFSLVTN